MMKSDVLKDTAKIASKKDEFANEVFNTMEHEFRNSEQIEIIRSLKAELGRRIELQIEECKMNLEQNIKELEDLKNI